MLPALVGLHASAKVHDELCLASDTAQHGVVHHVAAARSVQIHQMQAAETQLLEAASQRHGVVGIHFLRVVVPLRQAHALAVDEVNGGYQLNHSLRKFLNICSPTLPLFSGWNCVA